MAILTGTTVFSFFTFQILILVTSTKADPQIEVDPSEISLGISSSLDINCSFSPMDHPEMAAFVSLILSKANSSGEKFEDLASITQFSPDLATVSTREKVTATGVHSQTRESFIHLHWEIHTASQTGVYQCVAHGMDILGEFIEIVNSSTVTVAQADLNDVFEKLKEMEIHEINMEKHIKALEYNNSQMSSYITNLEDTVARLQRFQTMNFIGTFENHDYYVSKEGYGEINYAIKVCKSHGGYLTEIDNENEFNAIKGFLTNTSGFGIAMIAGTDEASDGTWIFQSNNKTLPFTRWFADDASTGTIYNCLGLTRRYSWNMDDHKCNYGSSLDGYRFTCEILHV